MRTEIEAERYRNAASPALAPASFVHKIDVPVFIAGSWQDQETGSHFADMLGDFRAGLPLKVVVMNGIHADSLGPAVLSDWIDFLDFYVARKVPSVSPATRALASVILARLFGQGVSLAPDRFTGHPEYATALAEYQSEPAVRVLFDVGAGGPPGAPVAAFSTTAPSWPLPGTTPTILYFGPGGTLTDAAPKAARGADTFRYDPSAFPRTDRTRDGQCAQRPRATVRLEADARRQGARLRERAVGR